MAPWDLSMSEWRWSCFSALPHEYCISMSMVTVQVHAGAGVGGWRHPVVMVTWSWASPGCQRHLVVGVTRWLASPGGHLAGCCVAYWSCWSCHLTPLMRLSIQYQGEQVWSLQCITNVSCVWVGRDVFTLIPRHVTHVAVMLSVVRCML